MKKAEILFAAIWAAWSVALSAVAADAPKNITGTFIQLDRATATNGVDQWRADLDRMQQAGLTTVIVQWSAEDRIAYFKTDLPYEEQYETLERLFEAAAGRDVEIYLGLATTTNYWMQLTARDKVLRDFLLVRVAHNEKLQQALLARFQDRPAWRGYYIPDEIDDQTWRRPEKSGLIKEYLKLMSARLRANDALRDIAVSAFFRGRTAPDLFAANLADITRDSGVQHVLVQDGVGADDPPLLYVPIYFKELAEKWQGEPSDLWCVIEGFQQTSRAGETFAAVPAAPDRLQQQIRNAQPYFNRLVLFSFLNYADPQRGKDAGALFQILVPAGK